MSVGECLYLLAEAAKEREICTAAASEKSKTRQNIRRRDNKEHQR